MAYVLNKTLKTRSDFVKAGLLVEELNLIDDEKANENYAMAFRSIANYKITPTKAAITAPAVKLLQKYGVDVGSGTAAAAKEAIPQLFEEHPSLHHEDPGMAFLKLVYWFKHEDLKPQEWRRLINRQIEYF